VFDFGRYLMIENELPEFATGLLSPKISTAALVERLRATGRTHHEIALNIAGNRCVLVADRVLASVEQDELVRGIRTELGPFLERAAARAAHIDPTVRLLDRISREHAIPIWGIKGLASRAASPDPQLRQLSDADIAVKSLEDAFYLADVLRRHGFVTDRWELPWFKHSLSGVPYGQYRLQGPDGLLSVDIHFGPGYSAGHCGLIPIPMPTQAGCHPLPVVANLGPMLGNSAGDAFITTKDVNDVWAAAAHLTASELDGLVCAARKVGFLGHLCEIARVTVELTSLEPASESIVKRLAAADGGKPGRRILASQNKPVKRGVRAARTARTAFEQAKELTGSSARAVVISATALAYYGVDLKVRVLPLPRRPSPAPAPWRCVRLVPASLAAEAPGSDQAWSGDAIGPDVDAAPVTGLIERVDVDGGQLIRHGDAMFLPTVWYLLSKRLIQSGIQIQNR